MLLLYCKNCNNLLNKIDETIDQGKTITIECKRCLNINEFYIKYKAYSKIVCNKDKKNI